jgi:superfamily II DNA/RNA helicase
MDMGFEEPVTQIVKLLKSHVQQRTKPLQTALISATLTDKIKKLAGFSLQDPVYIDVDEMNSTTSKEEGEDATALDGFHIPKMLHQNYVSVPCKQRLITLAAFLRWKAYSM